MSEPKRVEMSEPIEGRWYWVRGGEGSDWFPAMRARYAAGGWTNADTWEDFTREIVRWKPIPAPEEIP